MKLRLSQLSSNLERDLAPVYLIAGDEPLQAIEAADAVRGAARARGFGERLVLDAEVGFDWVELRTAADNLSLFSERRLLDLRMPSAKPAAAGSKALLEYAEHPPPDTLLLVQTGKLDRAGLNSAWAKALDRAGVVVQVWPLNARETMLWVAKRLAEKGFMADEEACSVLAERAQGNLLAASQEIEKLSLLLGAASSGGSFLKREQILASVADSARFTVFELADAALAGDCAQAVRILHGLASEDIKPPLVLWSLTEQVRRLANMADHARRGVSPDEALRSEQKERRATLLKQALRRETGVGWHAWLRRCGRADRIIKGQAPGEPWNELLNLTLGLCGKPLLATANEEFE